MAVHTKNEGEFMKYVAVIPARYASTRFPGKPLAMIQGKEMLAWTIAGTKKSEKLEEIFVATDHEDIYALAEREGAKPVMTASDLPTGTDRVYAAVEAQDVEIVVNVQGDEPLIDGKVLDLLLDSFEDPQVQMATLGREIKNEEDLNSETTAKIALDQNDYAIYFSRFPIPYSRNKEINSVSLKHIGIYAYRKSFLKSFCLQEPTALEQAEGLEQLRALYLGAKIKVVKVESESWGVDVPKDIEKIEMIMKQGGSNG